VTPDADLGLRSRVLRALSMGCELQGEVDAALAWGTVPFDFLTFHFDLNPS